MEKWYSLSLIISGGATLPNQKTVPLPLRRDKQLKTTTTAKTKTEGKKWSVHLRGLRGTPAELVAGMCWRVQRSTAESRQRVRRAAAPMCRLYNLNILYFLNNTFPSYPCLNIQSVSRRISKTFFFSFSFFPTAFLWLIAVCVIIYNNV